METEPTLILDAINQEVYFWSKPAEVPVVHEVRPQASQAIQNTQLPPKASGLRLLLVWALILGFCLASWGAVIWVILCLFRWSLLLLR